MKKLIKMIMIVASVGAMLSFAGCGKAPDKVALDFLQTMADGKADAEYLKKNCTEDTAKMIGLATAMAGNEATKEMKGASFSAVDTKIDGDKAVVTVKVSKQGEKDEEQKINLVKKDGQWKVDMNKEDKH